MHLHSPALSWLRLSDDCVAENSFSLIGPWRICVVRVDLEDVELLLSNLIEDLDEHRTRSTEPA